MRLILAIVGLLLLGACNMVVTKTPLFSKADTVGVSQLRPGVWREAPRDPCDFDEAKPLADWPACASGFVVKDGQVGGYNTDANGKKTWTDSELVVAGDDPRIMQVLLKDLGVKGLGDLPFGPTYLYVAARPTNRRRGAHRRLYELAHPVRPAAPARRQARRWPVDAHGHAGTAVGPDDGQGRQQLHHHLPGCGPGCGQGQRPVAKA